MKTERTNQIHGMIQMICNQLHTAYISKKHGGYNVYEDDKIRLSTDTYVPNVDVYVVLPYGNKERVFACGYTGDNPEYHPGKWEEYLESLYQVALIDAAKKQEEYMRKQELERQWKEAKASEAADAVFG